jgi:nitroreductase
MKEDIQEINQVFDEIVRSRRSVRSFKEDKPPKKLVNEIISTGMLAPYAAQAVGDKENFRRFFVFENNTVSMETASRFMMRKAADGAQHFEKLIRDNPFLKPKLQPFLEKLRAAGEKGVLGVGTAPYFIVVAELRGVPPVENESLAHTMENMWLKATVLDLGFHLVSLTSQMAEDEEFMKLLNLPVGKFALNGCAIGYPKFIPSATPRPDVKKSTIWMD